MKSAPVLTMLIITAIQALVVLLAWEYVLTPVFQFPDIHFGQAFLLVAVFNVLLYPILRAQNQTRDRLGAIEDIMLFSEQNGDHKFNYLMNYLDGRVSASVADAEAVAEKTETVDS